MGLIIVLEILLFFLMMFTYYVHDEDFLTPSFLFVISFVFSVAWAIAYADAWNLDLHRNTFFVILGGTAEFVLVSFLVHSMCKSFGNPVPHEDEYEDGSLSKVKLWIFAGLQVFATLYMIVTLRKLTGMSNLSEAIHAYRDASAFTKNAPKLPALLYYANLLVRGGGFWIAYMLAYQFVCKKKAQLSCVLCFLLSLVHSLLTGGRNDIVVLLLTFFFSYIILRNRKKGTSRSRLKLSLVVKVGALSVVGLTAFAYLTSFIGRRVKKADYLYYLAVYCGASIKNLDLYLQGVLVRPNIWGKMTFINLISYIGTKLGLENTRYLADLPYNKIRGRIIGNVYTTFYAFIYDFGYFGVVVMVLIMAVICQLVYEWMRRSSVKGPSLPILVYSYIAGCVIFSFFSNKFYENVFNIAFIRYIIVWIVFDIAFNRMRRLRFF